MDPALPNVAPAAVTATDAGTDAGTGDAVDYKALYEAATGDVDKWKGLSRQHEKRSKENADAAAAAAANQENLRKVAEALGLSAGDKAPDASAITAQLQAAQAAAAQQARENAVLRAAGRLAADGDALLDSRQFLTSIADLDPTDTAGINEAIKTAMKDNPRYAAAAAGAQPVTPPARQASGTADFNGSPGGQRQWTEADVIRATPAQVRKATADGLLAQYLSS
jgi:hypothetical protein